MEGQSESESESQRVVLAHDASRGVRVNSVRLVLDRFSLRAGDMLIFLSVLHEIQHPMGYMMRVDGVNQKAIDDEIAMKKKEYDDNSELVQVSKLYEMLMVEFKIELVAGPILKNVVVEEAKKINATWVIIDEKIMKRDKKYFLEKLSCGVSTTKRNDDIVQTRGPKLSTTRLSYRDNRNPVSQAENGHEDLFSIELEPSSTSSTSTRASFSEWIMPGDNQDDTINQMTTLIETNGEDQEFSPGEASGDHVETLPPMLEDRVQLDQKKCTTCNENLLRSADAWPQSRNFSYSELVEATNRFSSEYLIYRGENEVVFHGILKCSKLNVIVKVQHDMKKFKSEMQALEKTQNEHVIMLLGTCLEETARVLVFEYACNGSLDQHLSNQNSRPLSWPERIKIAIGACRGLIYLHGNDIIHGDMRPKNILLTHDFEPLISGFGLANMKNDSNNSSNHCIIGTLGYLAPEYRERGKSTTKTDVYAFGTILLQLVTGRSPTDTRLQGHSLIKWANSLLKERKFSEFIDPEISYDINQVVNIMQLALKCVRKDPHLRLSMEEVMFALDYIKDDKTGQRADESQEVNGNTETIGQSQRDFDEKLIFSYDGMTPLPKQAKHFYQGADV